MRQSNGLLKLVQVLDRLVYNMRTLQEEIDAELSRHNLNHKDLKESNEGEQNENS